MKLILFICISLLVSLLHAAAMPVDDIGGSPHAHHASMKHGSDQGNTEDLCPNNHNYCCLIVTLAPEEAASTTLIFRETFYASHPLNKPIIRLESLYRPPKFYLASTA